MRRSALCATCALPARIPLGLLLFALLGCHLLLQADTPPSPAPARITVTSSPLPPGSLEAVAPASTAQPALAPALNTKLVGTDKILILPIREEINQNLIYVVRRAFNLVRNDASYKAVVIDMNTPGGAVDITNEIVGLMRDCDRPVLVYINNQAMSAGSLISLASKHVYIAPGGVVGAATPWVQGDVPEEVKPKMLSYVRGMARSLAKENGYPPEFAEAFVDKNVEDTKIGDKVIRAKGEILTLDAEQAATRLPPDQHPILAKGIAANMEEVLTRENLAAAERETITPTGAEYIAFLITKLAPLLIVGFLLGLYIESHSPGFGVAGGVAIGCLALFLFGHYIAGLSGWLELLLIVLGIGLLLLELLVIPGFGITGFIGIFCLLTGLVMAMIPHIPKHLDAPGEVPTITWQPYLEHAMLNLAITLVITGVAVYVLSKYLPKSTFFNRLVLHSSATVAAGYVATEVVANRQLVGQTGVAMTTLRPAGTAEINGQRVDVVTQGDFINKGEAITVTMVDGPRVVVTRAAASA